MRQQNRRYAFTFTCDKTHIFPKSYSAHLCKIFLKIYYLNNLLECYIHITSFLPCPPIPSSPSFTLKFLLSFYCCVYSHTHTQAYTHKHTRMHACTHACTNPAETINFACMYGGSRLVLTHTAHCLSRRTHLRL